MRKCLFILVLFSALTTECTQNQLVFNESEVFEVLKGKKNYYQDSQIQVFIQESKENNPVDFKIHTDIIHHYNLMIRDIIKPDGQITNHDALLNNLLKQGQDFIILLANHYYISTEIRFTAGHSMRIEISIFHLKKRTKQFIINLTHSGEVYINEAEGLK